MLLLAPGIRPCRRPLPISRRSCSSAALKTPISGRWPMATPSPWAAALTAIWMVSKLREREPFGSTTPASAARLSQSSLTSATRSRGDVGKTGWIRHLFRQRRGADRHQLLLDKVMRGTTRPITPAHEDGEIDTVAGKGDMLRLPRMKSSTLSQSSRDWTPWMTALGVTSNSVAAALKLPRRPAASNRRKAWRGGRQIPNDVTAY